jgi:predicted transposase/invertase (TIGR01784 family)
MADERKGKYINPYTDFGFKKLFGTEPNKDILISFLNALFEGDRKPIVDLHYLNTAVLGPYYGDRSSVFDVYCMTEDDTHFVVEMQRSDQPFFKDRTVYYASASIVQQAPRGEWDYNLTDVCVVGILNFVFPNKEYPEDSYLHKVMLKDTDDNHEVYKKLAFYYVEMPKFKKKEDELVTMQDKWLFVVKNICYLLEQPKELQEKVFTKFFEEARIGMFNAEQRFAYMMSQKHYWDNRNCLNYSYEKGMKAGLEAGIKEGREAGLAEGITKVQHETAQKMLAAGIDKKTILEITGVEIDEEKKL